jgi:hypothetical protein
MIIYLFVQYNLIYLHATLIQCILKLRLALVGQIHDYSMQITFRFSITLKN